MAFAMGQAGALVVLFVFIPIVVGVIVMALIARSGKSAPPGTRTSELLSTGEAAPARVLAVRRRGSPIDLRPMVEFRVEVSPEAETPFELTVVQSMPAVMLRELTPGSLVEVRVNSERTAGAIVPPTT